MCICIYIYIYTYIVFAQYIYTCIYIHEHIYEHAMCLYIIYTRTYTHIVLKYRSLSRCWRSLTTPPRGSRSWRTAQRTQSKVGATAWARSKQERQAAERRTVNATRENRVLSIERSAVYTSALFGVLASSLHFLFISSSDCRAWRVVLFPTAGLSVGRENYPGGVQWSSTIVEN